MVTKTKKKNLKKLELFEIMINLKITFHQEKEMQDIMIDFFLNQEKDNKNNMAKTPLTYLFYHNSMYKNVLKSVG